MNERLTACCGLCCVDCIPSHSELFALVNDLDRVLEDLRFEEYAALKADGNTTFRDYASFRSVFRAIRDLRCPGPCRERGGIRLCAIRDCAQERGDEGCWQCGTRSGCRGLDRLRTVHPHLDAHLDLIAELGPSSWFEEEENTIAGRRESRPAHSHGGGLSAFRINARTTTTMFRSADSGSPCRQPKEGDRP